MAQIIDLTGDSESDSPGASSRRASYTSQISLDTGVPFGHRVRSTLARRSRSRSITPPDLSIKRTPVTIEAIDDKFTIATEDDWNTSDNVRTTRLREILKQPFRGTTIIEPKRQALVHARNEYDVLDLTNKLVFWTDGSHSNTGQNQGAGVAVVWRPLHYDSRHWEERGFFLAGENGSYGAEFFAMAEALKNAARICSEAFEDDDNDRRISAVTVYTDSQSTLIAIRDYHKGHKGNADFHASRQLELAKIKERAGKLVDIGVKVELRWTPGHEGIEGNCRADAMANKARRMTESFESLVPPRNGGLGLVVKKGYQATVVDHSAKVKAKATVVKEADKLKKTIDGKVKKTKVKGKKSTLWNRFASIANID